MSAIAVTAHVVAGALHRQRQSLVHKDRVLADTLTESVRRQRLLDAVLSAVSVGVWVVDQHGRHVLSQPDDAVRSRIGTPDRFHSPAHAASRRPDNPCGPGEVPG